MFPEVKTVLSRELLDAWRDRRTWVLSLVLPLIVTPLLMMVLTWVTGREHTNTDLPRILVENSEAAPNLYRVLTQVPQVEWLEPNETGNQGEAHLTISFPPHFEEDLATGAGKPVLVKFDSSKQSSVMALNLVREVFARTTIALGRSAVVQAGLPVTVIPILELEAVDTADKAALGALLLSVMLPMLLAVSVSVGGISLAIDSTAGEKERGTFESLLVSPLSRTAIAMGKFLAVWVAALLSLTSTILGIYIGVWMSQITQLNQDLEFSVSWLTGLLLLGTGAILGAVFAALQIAISAYARNFKEAQAYTSPLAIVPMLGAILSMAVESGHAPWYLYPVPVFNIILVIKDILALKVSGTNVLIAVATTGVLALVSVQVASRCFRNESILFRS
jgi:sodium transport system permease protein